MNNQLRPATDDEIAFWQWLRAEREWQVEQAQQRLWHLEEEQRQAEIAEKVRGNDLVIAEHEAAVASATGLRRGVLELHDPARNDPYRPYCSECSGHSDYEISFPCDTYVLARDHEEGS